MSDEAILSYFRMLEERIEQLEQALQEERSVRKVADEVLAEALWKVGG